MDLAHMKMNIQYMHISHIPAPHHACSPDRPNGGASTWIFSSTSGSSDAAPRSVNNSQFLSSYKRTPS